MAKLKFYKLMIVHETLFAKKLSFLYYNNDWLVKFTKLNCHHVMLDISISANFLEMLVFYYRGKFCSAKVYPLLLTHVLMDVLLYFHEIGSF